MATQGKTASAQWASQHPAQQAFASSAQAQTAGLSQASTSMQASAYQQAAEQLVGPLASYAPLLASGDVNPCVRLLKLEEADTWYGFTTARVAGWHIPFERFLPPPPPPAPAAPPGAMPRATSQRSVFVDIDAPQPSHKGAEPLHVSTSPQAPPQAITLDTAAAGPASAQQPAASAPALSHQGFRPAVTQTSPPAPNTLTAAASTSAGPSLDSVSSAMSAGREVMPAGGSAASAASTASVSPVAGVEMEQHGVGTVSQALVDEASAAAAAAAAAATTAPAAAQKVRASEPAGTRPSADELEEQGALLLSSSASTNAQAEQQGAAEAAQRGSSSTAAAASLGASDLQAASSQRTDLEQLPSPASDSDTLVFRLEPASARETPPAASSAVEPQPQPQPQLQLQPYMGLYTAEDSDLIDSYAALLASEQVPTLEPSSYTPLADVQPQVSAAPSKPWASKRETALETDPLLQKPMASSSSPTSSPALVPKVPNKDAKAIDAPDASASYHTASRPLKPDAASPAADLKQLTDLHQRSDLDASERDWAGMYSYSSPQQLPDASKLLGDPVPSMPAPSGSQIAAGDPWSLNAPLPPSEPSPTSSLAASSTTSAGGVEGAQRGSQLQDASRDTSEQAVYQAESRRAAAVSQRVANDAERRRVSETALYKAEASALRAASARAPAKPSPQQQPPPQPTLAAAADVGAAASTSTFSEEWRPADDLSLYAYEQVAEDERLSRASEAEGRVQAASLPAEAATISGAASALDLDQALGAQPAWRAAEAEADAALLEDLQAATLQADTEAWQTTSRQSDWEAPGSQLEEEALHYSSPRQAAASLAAVAGQDRVDAAYAASQPALSAEEEAEAATLEQLIAAQARDLATTPAPASLPITDDNAAPAAAAAASVSAGVNASPAASPAVAIPPPPPVTVTPPSSPAEARRMLVRSAERASILDQLLSHPTGDEVEEGEADEGSRVVDELLFKLAAELANTLELLTATGAGGVERLDTFTLMRLTERAAVLNDLLSLPEDEREQALEQLLAVLEAEQDAALNALLLESGAEHAATVSEEERQSILAKVLQEYGYVSSSSSDDDEWQLPLPPFRRRGRGGAGRGGAESAGSGGAALAARAEPGAGAAEKLAADGLQSLGASQQQVRQGVAVRCVMLQ